MAPLGRREADRSEEQMEQTSLLAYFTIAMQSTAWGLGYAEIVGQGRLAGRLFTCYTVLIIVTT